VTGIATEQYTMQTATEHSIAFVSIDRKASPQDRDMHNTVLFPLR